MKIHVFFKYDPFKIKSVCISSHLNISKDSGIIFINRLKDSYFASEILFYVREKLKCYKLLSSNATSKFCYSL
jgi:hypothetical protein